MSKLWFGYFFILVLFGVWSYSLTDPNLVISQWQPYWQFQQWMWIHFFEDRTLLTRSFGGLVVALFLVYGLILRQLSLEPTRIPSKHYWWWIALVIPLVLSYNALSHDVFNYMFNAKMVTSLQANPHLQVALDFPNQEWLRFMHNTHTPAPYGYGWTALSIIPYVAGMDRFLSTWLAFRVFSLASLVVLFGGLRLAAHKLDRPLSSWSLALVFLSPLLLIEVISNTHNDLWMIAPAVISLALAAPKTTAVNATLSVRAVFLSFVLLLFSILIKYSTAALIPVWLMFLVVQLPVTRFTQRLFRYEWLQQNWPFVCSILLFLPLFLLRSQQFHPWYLSWSLAWVPLFNFKDRWQRWWLQIVLAFSVSSLLRYIPWLWAGGFHGNVFEQQKLVTWVGAGLVLLLLVVVQRLKRTR